MTVSLESLFWKTHLDVDQNPLLLGLKLLIWTPIGVTLAISRLVGSISLLSVLLVLALVAPNFVLPVRIRRLLLFFIGIHIKIEGAENVEAIKKKTPNFILAANHRTAFDILPFGQFTPFAVMLDGGFFDGHPISRWFLKAVRHYMEPVKVEHFAGTQEQARTAQRDRIVSVLKREGRPLFYFPEGWDTNGKGLLRYQRFLFGMKLPVLPTAISVTVPFHVPIRPGMLGSSIFREIMWLFFSPYYTYHVHILPAIENDGEDDTAFAARAQRITAAALGVPPTDWSKNDALTYRRSLLKPKSS